MNLLLMSSLAGGNLVKFGFVVIVLSSRRSHCVKSGVLGKFGCPAARGCTKCRGRRRLAASNLTSRWFDSGNKRHRCAVALSSQVSLNARRRENNKMRWGTVCKKQLKLSGHTGGCCNANLFLSNIGYGIGNNCFCNSLLRCRAPATIHKILEKHDAQCR